MGALCSAGVPPTNTERNENATLLSAIDKQGKPPIQVNKPTNNVISVEKSELSHAMNTSLLCRKLAAKRSEDTSPRRMISHESYHDSGVHIDPSRKLKDFFKTKREILGNGGYGIVKLGIDKTTKSKVAIKIVNKERLSPTEKYDLYSQIGMLRHLEHDNIVSLVDVFETNVEVSIIMDCLTGGELFDRVISQSTKRQKPLTECRAAGIFKQILSALAYLHATGIVHRDLKPENLVFANASDNSLKLIDFDVAHQLDIKSINKETMRREWVKSNEFVGTMMYLAPEMWMEDPYDMSVDMWAAGCLLYCLLSGLLPFPIVGDQPDINHFGNAVVKSSKNSLFHRNKKWQRLGLSSDGNDICEKLLTKMPKNRLTAMGALEHPWLRNNRTAELSVDTLRYTHYQSRLRSGVQSLLALLRMIEAITVQRQTVSDGQILAPLTQDDDEEKRYSQPTSPVKHDPTSEADIHHSTPHNLIPIAALGSSIDTGGGVNHSIKPSHIQMTNDHDPHPHPHPHEDHDQHQYRDHLGPTYPTMNATDSGNPFGMISPLTQEHSTSSQYDLAIPTPKSRNRPMEEPIGETDETPESSGDHDEIRDHHGDIVAQATSISPHGTDAGLLNSVEPNTVQNITVVS